MTGRDRMVVIVIAVLLVIAAGWMLVVSPERKQASSLSAKVSAAKSALAKAEGELSSARQAQSKYAAAYAGVVSLGKAVPASEEVPSLIYQLSQASGQRSVEFNSITAGGGAAASSSTAAATTAAAGFSQMPFTFVFNGGFFQLERLFSSLTAFTTHRSSGGLDVSGRLLTIQSVKLSPEANSKPGAAPKLTGTVAATAYVLPPGEQVTNGATATSPTGSTTPASTTTAPAATAPAVVKVTP